MEPIEYSPAQRIDTLAALLQDPEVDISDVGTWIEGLGPLPDRILRAANRTRCGAIRDIDQAIVMLGFNAIQEIFDAFVKECGEKTVEDCLTGSFAAGRPAPGRVHTLRRRPTI